MGAQFNIKDVETIELARDLARQLGKSVTVTIREALQEKRERREADKEAMVRDVMAMARQAREHWRRETAGMTSDQLIDGLYDERGLPK